MTPNFAIIRVETPRWHGFPILLPLFLLWIPLVLFSPLILLVVAGMALAGHVDPWRAIAALWDLSCSLPGTSVEVRTNANQVAVRIF
jgi:hypothetical protein